MEKELLYKYIDGRTSEAEEQAVVDWLRADPEHQQELNALWYDTEGTWDAVHAQAKDLDELINEFNEATGLLKNL